MLASNAVYNTGQPSVTANDNNDPPLSYEEFFVWLDTSVPGDRCVYHAGFLPTDRHFDDQTPPEQRIRAQAIGEYASIVYKLARKGDVGLSQRKLDVMNYRYYATRK